MEPLRGPLRPYTPPLVRSIAAPIGRLIPARSGGKEAPAAHFATEDNVNDRANPYAIGGGGEYGPIPSLHNARATGARLAPRTAIGTAYITPPALWNLAGVSSSFLQVLKAPRNTVKLAMGRWTPMQSNAPAPLPTLPEPARMIQPRLP